MDEKQLEEILKGYREQLEELEEIKARNSARYSQMSEDEFVNALTQDYEEVYEHAMKNDVTIAIVPNEDDKK